DPVALRGDQRRARVQQFLGGVEDVEGRALSDARFFAHTVERSLGREHLSLGREDLRLGGVELPPELRGLLLNRVALVVELNALLAQRFLGLADGRVLATALIERNRDRAERLHLQRAQEVRGRRRRIGLLRLDRGDDRRVERALVDLHLQSG